jgi:hypothetical protein
MPAGQHIRANNQLSRETSEKSRLQRACLKLLRDHLARGEIPTSARFIYYELVQSGVVSKKDKRAATRVGAALAYLRYTEHIPWDWIVDETRSVNDHTGHDTIEASVLAGIDHVRLDPWEGNAPLIITESRSLSGVLANIADEYRVKIASTNGQAGGFLRTDLVPQLDTLDEPRVLYIGDHDFQGHQIEQNTRDVLEEHVGDIDWERIALTEEQVAEHGLEDMVIMKEDRGFDPPRSHRAIETEALTQSVIVEIVRDALEQMLPTSLADVKQDEQRQRAVVRRRLTRTKCSTRKLRR